MSAESVVDLGKARGDRDVHNLAGRERGSSVRRHFDLDRLDQSQDRVQVVVPNDLYAISPSFFLGMFSQSINRLGRDGFLRKYTFKAEPWLLRQIARNVERVSSFDE